MFVIEYRRKIWVKGVSRCLRVIFQEIGEFRRDVEIIGVDCDKDYVHLHIVIPPKYVVSDIVGTLTANTAAK